MMESHCNCVNLSRSLAAKSCDFNEVVKFFDWNFEESVPLAASMAQILISDSTEYKADQKQPTSDFRGDLHRSSLLICAHTPASLP
jgi:hypothetical protein